MTLEKYGWKKEEIAPGHFIFKKAIDPEIIKQMPKSGSKPFTQVTLGEFTIKEIKNAIELVKGLVYKV